VSRSRSPAAALRACVSRVLKVAAVAPPVAVVASPVAADASRRRQSTASAASLSACVSCVLKAARSRLLQLLHLPLQLMRAEDASLLPPLQLLHLLLQLMRAEGA
jgi:hypothetical protein